MKLTQDKLEDAAVKCLSNAEDLIDDAILLKSNNRKERAYALFQLATEEVGKALKILLYLLFDKLSDKKETKKFLDDFRSHKEKTIQSIALDNFVLLIGKNVISDKLKFLEASLHELENVNALNDLKNFSLYTSFYEGDFKTPKEIIKSSHLDTIEFRALTRYKVAKKFIKSQLTCLDELKEYISSNPVKLSEDELAKIFWEELEE